MVIRSFKKKSQVKISFGKEKEKRLKNLGVVLVGISQTAAAGRDGGKNRDKQGGNKMNSGLV